MENLLPSNTEYEKSILSAMLQYRDSCEQAIEKLSPDDFYGKKNRQVFEACRKLFQEGAPVEVTTVYNFFKKADSADHMGVYLAGLVDSQPQATDIPYYADELKRCTVLRKTIIICDRAAKNCCAPNADAFELTGHVQREISGLENAEQETCRFNFIHNADVLADLKPTEWQIKDILVENSLYYDFGDPGSFKTFVALDRLLCVAAGIDYHGHKVKQGTVFYIAGEGQQGIGRRIAAWHVHHKTKARDIPFFLAKTPTQLMDTGALDDVRRTVDGLSKEYGSPAVLHIDTLARNFGEGDENATKDMNRVIQNMDTAFSNDFCRGITHHTGHSNKDRARGSIALHGAADAAFRISVTEGQQVIVECTKMKDACGALPMLFDLKTVLLLIDDEKDQSYTLTLAAEGDDAAAAKAFSNTCKASEPMKKALDLLDSMYAKYEENLAAGGHKGNIPRVAVSDWRDACLRKKLYQRTGNFNRALESMQKRKLVHLDENGVYVYSVSIYLNYIEKEQDLCTKRSETESN